MAKWGEIKCPRCAELEAKLIETAKGLAGEIRRADTAKAKLAENDALWEGMKRALEESDAREARLERWLSQSENREATLNDRITMLEEQLCAALEQLDDAEATLAELTGGKDE